MGNHVIDIKTGFNCNNNCRFCVITKERKKKGNKTTSKIKDSMRKYKEKCDHIVFTGGEITIRDDIIELVGYAKELDYKVIEAQTNGRMFKDIEFCKKIKEAGMNNFGPSIHGPNSDVHDFLTNSPGSFMETVRGIRNMDSLGITAAPNSVITKSNYRYLEDTAELFNSLGINVFQFAFPHANGSAEENFDNIVPYKTMVIPYLKKAIDASRKNNIKTYVEAIPFCLMEGYEESCTDLYSRDTSIQDFDMCIDDWVNVRKKIQKVKFEKCKDCKYDLLCEGPWVEYPERRGSDEFVPVHGKKIKTKEELLSMLPKERFVKK